VFPPLVATIFIRDRDTHRVKGFAVDPARATALCTRLMSDEGGSFDQVLAQLRGIVERLEGGNLSLEQSLAAFEEGVRLSRTGARILDAAEQRVEILLKDESGAERAVPFGNGGGGGDPGGQR
jgi:exodeoxyribonuclease VII small subunit